MRYYERIFLTEPDKKVHKIAEAVVPLIVNGKKLWHVLFSQDARDRIEKDSRLSRIKADSKRIPTIATAMRWSKLPHVFGPGRKPDLDDALDEDVYARREKEVDKLVEITDTIKTGG